jgi:hypothetical protein
MKKPTQNYESFYTEVTEIKIKIETAYISSHIIVSFCDDSEEQGIIKYYANYLVYFVLVPILNRNPVGFSIASRYS